MEPKRGDVFRWNDENHPIVVDNVDNLFVWVWMADRHRAIKIEDWKVQVKFGDLVPF